MSVNAGNDDLVSVVFSTGHWYYKKTKGKDD
jgi:hypothetical protein